MSAPMTSSQLSGFLKPEEAAPIFDQAAKESAVQMLAQKIPMGASGQAIPVTTTPPTAAWTGEAQDAKVSDMTLGVREMLPKKLTAIAVVSEEVIRANPANYVEHFKAQIATAFARAFDFAALHGRGGDGTGSGPFETAIGATTSTVALGAATAATGGLVADLGASLDAVLAAGYKPTAFLLDDLAEGRIRPLADAAKNKVWVRDLGQDPGARVTRGTLLDRPGFLTNTVASAGVAAGSTVGFVGDWSQAAWGVINEGIRFSVATEATVKMGGELVSTWSRGLVAIKATAEFGFTVGNKQAFAKLTVK